MKVTAKVNKDYLNYVTKIAQDNLVRTADAIKGDLIKSQTMPFGQTKTTTTTVYGKRGRYSKSGREYKGKQITKTKYQGGTLQNNATFIDTSKKAQNKVSIVSDTPYARRLYFHPEYNFYKGANSNAGGMWFSPYITGSKKDYARKIFARFMKRSMQ